MRGANRLILIAAEGRDGTESDWVDWLDPRLVSANSRNDQTSLTALTWARATSGYREVLIDQNCVGGALLSGGRGAQSGIGTHAPSVVEYPLPPGRYARFLARVGPDDGSPGRARTPSEVEFFVYVDK